MFVARLTCSDADCAQERTAEVATVAELEALACDCGAALEVIAWPDWTDEEIAEAIVVRLRREQRRRPLGRAA
jgi:hypothetical protein